jgi:hypothetical protein
MVHRAIAAAVLVAWATAAQAVELENLRVSATLVAHGSKDPFHIRGRIEGVDPMDVVHGPLTLRFGSLRARIPAGAFRRRNGSYVWRSYLFGVKKVTINVRKATLDVVGGNTVTDPAEPIVHGNAPSTRLQETSVTLLDPSATPCIGMLSNAGPVGAVPHANAMRSVPGAVMLALTRQLELSGVTTGVPGVRKAWLYSIVRSADSRPAPTSTVSGTNAVAPIPPTVALPTLRVVARDGAAPIENTIASTAAAHQIARRPLIENDCWIIRLRTCFT